MLRNQRNRISHLYFLFRELAENPYLTFFFQRLIMFIFCPNLCHLRGESFDTHKKLMDYWSNLLNPSISIGWDVKVQIIYCTDEQLVRNLQSIPNYCILDDSSYFDI